LGAVGTLVVAGVAGHPSARGVRYRSSSSSTARQTNYLCFAEASSDVVEFLTALLSLPLGTITSLLAKENMAGSVGTLLRSTEKLGAMYNSRERNLIPAVARPTLLRLQMLLGVQMNVDGELYVCAGKDIDHTQALPTVDTPPRTVGVPAPVAAVS
jgi:hypothetical protein